jgi:hypothetical protein
MHSSVGAGDNGVKDGIAQGIRDLRTRAVQHGNLHGGRGLGDGRDFGLLVGRGWG